MAGNMHLKPIEKHRLSILAQEHPTFKGMKESEIAHQLIMEASGKAATEAGIDWDKKAKSLKETDKSDEDGVLGYPGISFSNLDIQFSPCLTE